MISIVHNKLGIGLYDATTIKSLREIFCAVFGTSNMRERDGLVMQLQMNCHITPNVAILQYVSLHDLFLTKRGKNGNSTTRKT